MKRPCKRCAKWLLLSPQRAKAVRREPRKGKSHQVSDRMMSYLQVRGFPPFRQEKGERMGHGRWYINALSENQAVVALVHLNWRIAVAREFPNPWGKR